MPNKSPFKVNDAISNNEHPEWGQFVVTFDDIHGEWLNIRSSRGERVLHYSEAERFWKQGL